MRTKPHIFLVLILTALSSLQLSGQISNDECSRPVELELELGNWCSDAGEFTNEGSSLSTGFERPECFPADDEDQGDVWFSFVAVSTDISVLVKGNTANQPAGTIENPQFAVFEGNCGGTLDILACQSDAFGENVAEIFVDRLTIGRRYYILVSARSFNRGTFQLCINSFNSVPDPTSDCIDAVLLCEKASFSVNNLQGVGRVTNEVAGTCIAQEFASAWYKWICEEPGTLTFTLTPSNPTDDLDFALYELPNGIDDCGNKQLLRCMASGENVGLPFENWEPCTGPTGLMLNDADIEELPGCQDGNNNFVRHIDMEEGQAYALVVNNFSNTGNGFNIDWGGTGTFRGPKADIFVDLLEGEDFVCDRAFQVDEEVDFELGSIVSYQWNFGTDAIPQNIEGEGPHEVIYSQVGEKSIVLSVVTDSGCVVNEVVQVEVESCCEDTTELMIDLDDSGDLRCFNIPEGFIDVSASGGTPGYQYSLDNDFFQFNDLFEMLPAGEFVVYARDVKGCLDSLEVALVQPPELIVDAGPDQTVDLGFGTLINSTLIPLNWPVDYQWQPDTLIDFPGAADIFVTPPGTTTYTVTVTDPQGCTDTDTVTIFTRDNRPIYIPNAISPDQNGVNDRFTAYGNVAAERIEVMRIFNRWGNKVYEDFEIPLNDERFGWDGTFNGEPLDPAVFAYYIVVSFIDGVEVSYEGNIHVMR